MDWEELGIDKEEVEKFMNKGRHDQEDIGELPESGDQQESDEQEKYTFKYDINQIHTLEGYNFD